jgi:hypothetical protein
VVLAGHGGDCRAPRPGLGKAKGLAAQSLVKGIVPAMQNVYRSQSWDKGVNACRNQLVAQLSFIVLQ